MYLNESQALNVCRRCCAACLSDSVFLCEGHGLDKFGGFTGRTGRPNIRLATDSAPALHPTLRGAASQGTQPVHEELCYHSPLSTWAQQGSIGDKGEQRGLT
jgi:hypothetical protein